MVGVPLSSKRKTALVYLQSSAFKPNACIQVFSSLETTKPIGFEFFEIRPAQDLLVTLAEMGKAKSLQDDFVFFLGKVYDECGKLFAGQDGISARITGLYAHSWHFQFDVFSVEPSGYFDHAVWLDNAQRTVHGGTCIILLSWVFESSIEQVLFLWGLADHVDGFCGELEQIFEGTRDDLVLHVSYYNMLRIEVQGVSLERKAQGKLVIQVEGSRSGKLVSETIDAANAEWNPYFRVDCNQNDKLVFRVIAIDGEKTKELGVCELYCGRFVKENRKKLNSEYPTQYSLDILDGQNFEGTLNTYILFDPTLSFQGQFPQNVSLSLNNLNDPLPVYMGKCGTANAFSFLDEPAQGQYCKFSESIYRDHS